MQKNVVSHIALVVALVAVIAAGVMVFGSSMGLWDPITGFVASRTYHNVLGYIVVAVALVSLVSGIMIKTDNPKARGTAKSVVALLLGIAMLSPMLKGLIIEPVRYPPIHDITTDTQSPPQFTFLTDSRIGAKNTLVYGGAEIAAQQLQAYPDIQPILSDLPAEAAFAKTLDVAKAMGWAIVDQQPKALRFEASARTPFFNFADDVVVVVASAEQGSRIDLRSVSRIGRGDAGVNAKRIKEFSQRFTESL
ncbi:DUF1499 domain-containing protein [Shewanella saliphila]|uniref:DUF1499 domain-containing protein n=1 Tax=Shewanella saliphila TaxID=2282698 RepID=A0ABQ2Q2Q7_9GAMM|nr:DUF1499 domain-containing protein [Shewanella saliphila]MCL1100724.1 DUF1499 domain-containing protein [Shewanella saliphila]GGP41977.1 hypothetical protein GCM10009409_06110 [Shewanella saliphila]